MGMITLDEEQQEPTVTIGETRYKELIRDEAILAALDAAGVDNWDGYDEALASAFFGDEVEEEENLSTGHA